MKVLSRRSVTIYAISFGALGIGVLWWNYLDWTDRLDSATHEMASAIQLGHENGEASVATKDCTTLLAWFEFSSRSEGLVRTCIVCAEFPDVDKWVIVKLNGYRQGEEWEWFEGEIVGGPPSRLVLDHRPSSREIRILTDDPAEYWWKRDFVTDFGTNEEGWRVLTGDNPPEFGSGMAMQALRTKWLLKLNVIEPPN